MGLQNTQTYRTTFNPNRQSVLGFNPNRSSDFGKTARLCHAACFPPSRRRSGLHRGVARNRMRTKAGKMPESLISPIRNGHGVSDDRFGLNNTPRQNLGITRRKGIHGKGKSIYPRTKKAAQKMVFRQSILDRTHSGADSLLGNRLLGRPLPRDLPACTFLRPVRKQDRAQSRPAYFPALAFTASASFSISSTAFSNWRSRPCSKVSGVL